MKITFRLPGATEYSYAEVTTTEGSPQDIARELRDIDDNFLNLIGTVAARGCALMATGVLNPTVIQDSTPASDPAAPAAWNAPAAQEAQAYAPQYQPQYQPQQAPQSFQSAYQPQAAPAAPAPQGPPPGMPAPICNHGIAMKYFAPGRSERTGKPYGASWRCQANVPRDQQCKAQWLD